MSQETLLGDDGGSIPRSARDGGEDVVPDGSLILLVGTGAGSLNGEDADIISSKFPDGEGTTKRSNQRVRALQHTVHPKSILLLSGSFFLEVYEARRDVLLVDGLTFLLVVGNLFLEFILLVCKPLLNLGAAEGKLVRAVGDIQDGKGMLHFDLVCHGKSPLSWSRH
jgi:hypothetical protein